MEDIMKELPKIYNNDNKKFNNNKKVYLLYSDSNPITKPTDIKNKITNILSSPDFIYRTTANILIDNNLITKKIIGIKNNNLITIDNEHIPIDKIQDIYK